jgi:hypothetical protein
MNVSNVTVVRASSKPKAERVYCGRGGEYGNPFIIGLHGGREDVCRKFDSYFNTMMVYNPAFRAKVEYLVDLASAAPLELECFCAPRACHCNTYKKHIDKILNSE